MTLYFEFWGEGSSFRGKTVLWSYGTVVVINGCSSLLGTF